MATSLRWYIVGAELDGIPVQQSYHVVSDLAARARFESDFGIVADTCREMTPDQAIDFANRQDRDHERRHDVGDDCQWCAEGIPH